MFDVSSDPLVLDNRVVDSVAGIVTDSSGNDGRPRGFNDAGQLAFRLRFTDESEGIFVATIAPTILGDVNGDGVVSLLDIQPFVEAIISEEFSLAADTNLDGEVNLLDVAPFVDILIGQ